MNSVNKKPIVGGIILVVILGMVVVGAQINPDNPENEKRSNSEVWSTRIAGPEFADISIHKFSPVSLERNAPYKFEFVPMGDSPKRLQISVVWSGQGVQVFSELFILEKTLVDTGISKYYTWDYTGNKSFEISTKQCPNQKICGFDIIVQRADMSGLKGSVTISLSR